MLALTTLTGCQGVNGGGWAHYVGQEKCRPVTGWAQLAFGAGLVPAAPADDRTAYWYLHTDQWRYDGYDAGALASPLGNGASPARTPPTCSPGRPGMGWMPTMPTFDRNPLDVADEALAANPDNPGAAVVDALQRGPAGLRRRGPGRAAELAPGAHGVAGQPARLQSPRATSTSCATCSAPTRPCGRPRRRRTAGPRR